MNGGYLSTSPLDGTLGFATVVLLTAALASGYAISAEPSRAAQGKLPPYLDRSLFGGGNGLSNDTAVIVKVQSEARGVSSEYAWIASRYPGSKPLGRLLTATDDGGKRYDVITVQTSVGTKIDLWFDISAMYQREIPSDYRWTDRERIWFEVRRWAAPQLRS